MHPSTATALNVTVYPALGGDPSLSLVQTRNAMTSGAYDDAIAGVATPQATLSAGKHYIVPSTYNPGSEAAFRIIIYSSVSGVKVTSLGS